jgi:hypothetical protein
MRFEDWAKQLYFFEKHQSKFGVPDCLEQVRTTNRKRHSEAHQKPQDLKQI